MFASKVFCPVILGLVCGSALFAQADLVGPDGRLYPDFRRAGAHPGPRPDLVLSLADFGGRPNDGKDDTAAFQAALAELDAKKGGTLRLAAGQYQLSHPLCITSDNTWIKGAGKDLTRIEFTYELKPGEIRFAGLADQQTVPLDTTVEVHAYPGPGDSTYAEKAPPGQLKLLTLSANGKVVATRKQDEGGPFNVAIPLWRITTAAGPLALTAKVEWTDGKTAETQLTLNVESTYLPEGQRRLKRYEAAFTFIGDEWTHRSWYRWPLATDAARGATRLTPARGETFPRALDLPFIAREGFPPAASAALKPGDSVAVTVFPTPEWKKATGNVPDFARNNFARVAAIEGDTIILDRPLRIDFPVAEKARLDARFPIRNGGVEGFTLVQTKQIWTHGILFQNAEDCIVRDVRVVKAGRNPVAIESSLQCEISDSEFDDGWYQIGGGTSYLGLGTSFDCLIQRIKTTRLRHAPIVNWSAAGNVFSQSSFYQSDANWHSGWCHENLVEACTIDASKGSGSYGWGIYTSRPETGHGSTGPRNVFWGNTILSPQTGAFLGGAVQGTAIVYNRFVVSQGPGVEAMSQTTGTSLIGNQFFISNANQPFFKNHRTGTGWEVVNNTIYGGNGNLTIASSPARAKESGNIFKPLVAPAGIAPPRPPAASLREWQLAKYPLR